MARPHPALLALAATGELPEVTDTREFLRSTREHRMSGMVCTAPVNGAWSGTEALHELQQEVDRSRDWNARLWESLNFTVTRLAGLGIEVAAIKGVTSEVRWYDQQGQRPSRDIDVLVAPADARRAAEIITALQPGQPLASVAQRWIDRGALQAATLTIDGVTVDVHFDPLKLGIRCRQADLVWSRTQPMHLPGGGSVRVLDPEISLVLFLLHLNKDRFRYLLGLVDVDHLIGREDVDWDFVTAFLAAEGMSAPAALSLDVVATTLGRPFPRLLRSDGLRTRVWNLAWRPSIRLQGEQGRVRYRKRQELLPLLGTGRAREGLVNLWRVLVPPRELYEIANPGEHGGYLRRVMVTRPLRYLRRLRT